MIMNYADVSAVGKRHVQVITISSFMLDALMSSTGSAASVSSLKKVESNSLQVSPTKVTRVSATNEKRSALKFIPQQIHKVHKRSKDRCHRSLIRRSDNNYTPILDALKARGLRDDDESQRKNDIETPVRGGSPEPSRQPSLNISNRARSPEPSRKSSSNTSRRSKSPEESGKSRSSRDRSSETSRKSHKSTHERDQSSESVLENDRYRKISPVRYSLSQSSVLSRNSCSDQNLDDDSSIYVTPEQTSVSMRSPDENRRTSSFKRSLCDDHQDESHSNNSSFNDSSYQTPESTPSKFNSAKRMKIRWSETSVFNQDSSSYLSWRLNLSSTSEQGIQPELIGYQMVGDSQFCRFGQQLLGLQRVPMPNSPGRIGMCVSGQTITDLHRRVKEGFYPISEKIILMIGTNDFLRNVNVSRMCEELSALIKTLQKNASTIILLTLPPIPKLAKKSVSHFELLDVYNQHIRSLENGETLRIADISPLYMTCPPYQRCRMHLFELFFGGAEKRHDLIHLNRLGLEVIRKYILDKFL